MTRQWRWPLALPVSIAARRPCAPIRVRQVKMRLRPKNRLELKMFGSHKASVEILGMYGVLVRALLYRMDECDRVMYPGAKYSHVTSE